jgi:hypothetical protein
LYNKVRSSHGAFIAKDVLHQQVDRMAYLGEVNHLLFFATLGTHPGSTYLALT